MSLFCAKKTTVREAKSAIDWRFTPIARLPWQKSKHFLLGSVVHTVSFKNQPSPAIRGRLRIERRLDALISVCVALSVLAGASVLMKSFGSEPVPEYQPYFTLIAETTETSCGGMGGCTNPNYTPPRPTPVHVQPLIIPRLESWEDETWQPETPIIPMDDSTDALEFD